MVKQLLNDNLTLQISDLQVHFPVSKGLVKAVDGISAQFEHGKITGIIGESGCGKSVLGQALLGLLPDYVTRSGQILYRGTDILANAAGIPGFYGQEFALIPQNPGDALNPLRKIGRQFDDILQAAALKDNDQQLKRSLLSYFGLSDTARILSAYPHELSGGMLQRVLCAMSICCAPHWLLADEPTKGLDELSCTIVYDNLQKIKLRGKLGMLVITHDLQLARTICDRLAIMYAGQIVEYGKRLLTEPRHPYTKAFLNALPGNGFQPLAGLPPSPQEQRPGCRFAPRCSACMERCRHEMPPPYMVDDTQVRCFLYA